MPTPTERRIIQTRHAKKTGAILVPILEDVLEHECIPETPQDFRFMDMLIRARTLPRQKGVFSPSMLGSCIRQAYFAKRGEEKVLAGSPRTNGYFLTGNFIHLKWQFALWRAHTLGKLELVSVPIDEEEKIVRALCLSGDENHSDEDYVRYMDALDFYGNGTRPGVEVRVHTRDNPDFMGTIDGLITVLPRRKAHIVDFKGINVIDYQRTLKRGAKREYRVQLTGYGWNLNLSDLPVEVEDCLLVSENKAGPDNSYSSSPLALHETRVPVAAHLPEVKRRLRTLRWYDSRNEVPPPACYSTTLMAYQECPFQRYCRDEVKATQRERERKAAKNGGKRNLKVAKPAR
jgi:hypothetical protein